MPSGLQRLIRTFFLALFLAGGAGIPGLDALLYHQTQAAGEPQGIHVEPQGTSCHQDACLAGLALARGADVPGPVTHHAGPTAAVRPSLTAAAKFSPHSRSPSSLPRSPPSL